VTEGIIDALAIARAEFERRLTAVTDDCWGRPTPCTEWNVRQLVNHIVSHEYRYADEDRLSTRVDHFSGSGQSPFCTVMTSTVFPSTSWGAAVTQLSC
jgi:uncharacterized protein (TIGR03083 family)